MMSKDQPQSLPTTGIPDSTGLLRNPDGSMKQGRTYGPDGRVVRDRDFSHPGVGHEFPHDHEWDWNKIPPRQPGVPVPTPQPAQSVISDQDVGDMAGWVLVGTALYWIISVGSRIVFPPRNFVPIP